MSTFDQTDKLATYNTFPHGASEALKCNSLEKVKLLETSSIFLPVSSPTPRLKRHQKVKGHSVLIRFSRFSFPCDKEAPKPEVKQLTSSHVRSIAQHEATSNSFIPEEVAKGGGSILKVNF